VDQSTLSIIRGVRRACRLFIKHPTLKIWIGIALASRNDSEPQIQVPCLQGYHKLGEIGERKVFSAEGCRCDSCPLRGFLDPNGTGWICPAAYRQERKYTAEAYRRHKGELVIAMVQFNEGFIKLKKGKA
jgi:hypothetical protein